MIGKTVLVPSSGGFALPLDLYIPQVSAEIDPDIARRAVVVFPGGGYEFLSEREAEPVALALAAAGFNAFVAHNRVAPNRFPAPLADAGAAVAYVRKNARALHTAPDSIAVLGFSAGGHLAGSLGTRWQEAQIFTEMGLSPEDVRPNAMVLCYPVITGGAHAHRGSFRALTGTDDIAAHERFSLEKRVSAACPPTFLWHTFEDSCVPVQNSLLMASALAEAGVMTELHVFPYGEHGSSLCCEQTSGVKSPHFNDSYNAAWLAMAVRFLQKVMP